MKDMVTRPAMDAAIKLAVDTATKTVRDNERGIRLALSEVAPYVGELSPTLALDSADDVYRAALKIRGVADVEKINSPGLRTILTMQPKAGARQVERLAMDTGGAGAADFHKMFPGAAHIGAA